MEENGSGLVLFLVDESQSLRTTDLDNDRVVSLVERVQEVGDYQRQRQQPIEVMIGGFGTGYQAHTPWLNMGDESDIRLAISEAITFLSRTEQIDTDYFLAFEGAAQALEEKSIEVQGATGSQPCTALYWITDGEYDIEPRLTDQQREFGTTKSYANRPAIDITDEQGALRAERLGEELLCAADGPVARLNDGETSSLAIILTSGSDSVDISVAEKVMRGVPGGKGCESRLGALETTDDFGEIPPVIGKGLPGIRDQSGLEGKFTFGVSPLMSSINAVLTGDGEAVIAASPRLRAPDGSELELDIPAVIDYHNQQGSLDGQAVSWRWTERSVYIAIDLNEALDTASEEWAIVWRSNDPSITARISATTIYQIEIVTADGRPLIAGEDNEIFVKVLGPDGQRLPPGTLDDVEAVATIDFGDGALDLPLDRSVDGYTATARVPEEADEARVTVEIDGIEESDGLNESRETEDLAVALPGFPAVELSVADFQGTGVLIGNVTAIGDEDQDSCVWLDSLGYDPITQVRMDDGKLTTPELGSQETCQPVPAGDVVTFNVPLLEVNEQEFRKVEISPVFGRRNEVSGGLDPAELAPVQSQLAPEVTGTEQTLVLVIILLLTLLAALTFNRLFAYLFQGYQVSDSLRRVEAPVVVTSDGVRLESGEPLTSLFVMEAPRVDSRPPTSTWCLFGRQLNWMPWMEPHGTANATEFDYLIGSSGSDRDYTTGKVALGLRGEWVLGIKDPNTPSGPGAPPRQATGSLVTFVEDPDELGRVAESLQAGVATHFERLPWGTTIDLRKRPAGSDLNESTSEMALSGSAAGLSFATGGGDATTALESYQGDPTAELEGFADQQDPALASETHVDDDDLLLPEEP
ncbi:MAG: hypothetical protein ACRBK7_23350 [Acidimicrobiales bacterium]